MLKKLITQRIHVQASLILLLCTILLATFPNVTVCKYVTKLSAGYFDLTVESDFDVYLLKGEAFNQILADKNIKEIIFDTYTNYPAYRDRTDGTRVAVDSKNLNSNVAKSGKIQLFYDDTKVYVLSEGVIYANPNSDKMFFNCGNLTRIEFNCFNTQNVTSVQDMFSGCFRMRELDISSFETDRVTNMSYMFSNCVLLKVIYASNKWSTRSVSEGQHMFLGCRNLVGGKGTVCHGYNFSELTHSYAKIDGGESDPGYFTLR